MYTPSCFTTFADAFACALAGRGGNLKEIRKTHIYCSVQGMIHFSSTALFLLLKTMIYFSTGFTELTDQGLHNTRLRNVSQIQRCTQEVAYTEIFYDSCVFLRKILGNQNTDIRINSLFTKKETEDDVKMGKMEAFHQKCLQWQMYIDAFKLTSLLVICSELKIAYSHSQMERKWFCNQLYIITLHSTGYRLSLKFSVISEIF